MYLATTRGSLLRGSADSGHGDVVDSNVTPVTGCEDDPIGLVERSRRTYDPASSEWRTLRYMVARVPTRWAVQDGDRVRDDRTGEVYIMTDYTRVPRGLSGQESLTLELSLTD